MKRRQFLKIAGTAIAFAPWLESFALAAEGNAATASIPGIGADLDIRSLFDAGSEEVMALTENVFRKCNMDGMTMTVHPKRKGPGEGAWYADICVPGNTAYLILAGRSLARLATRTRDKAMAVRREQRIQKAVQAMQQHMWDEQAGTFLSVKRDTLEKIPAATIGSWIPLAAGVPTEAMGRRMAGVLASPAWQTPLPVPTVGRTDQRWKSNAFWRGDVWPPTNYQIVSGLAACGHKDLAADIADKTIANAIKNGISEHYDSDSGQPLGIRDYCMSCTLVTMMLDGIAKAHRLKVKTK